MGAAGSSNGAPTPTAPFRERDGDAFVYGTAESCCPEYSNENIRQRSRSSAFDVGEEPRSQGPSPYATFGGEEWWSQRPSAPSLSNFRPPRQETLLTYAARMTGWQSAEGHSPSFSREAMELSKVISQLATANQQLAAAHTATLAHLESLYCELRREKESRRCAVPAETPVDEALKKRLTMDEDRDTGDEEDGRRAENWNWNRENSGCRSQDRQQRNVRQEQERKLRSRIDRLEAMMRCRPGREDERQRFPSSVCDPVENGRNERMNGVPCAGRLSSDNRVPADESRAPLIPTQEQVAAGSRQRSVRDWEEAVDPRCAASKDDSEISSHLEEARPVDEERNGLDRVDQVARLTEEIERLKVEQLECRGENERLTKELGEQKATITKLSKDCRESKMRREETESSLRECREECDRLMRKFDVATDETKRLLKEIDEFTVQRDTAEARISTLEQDLQQSLAETERIKNVESEKSSELQARLSAEMSDKRKQIKALEDALDEIQRLKETIKTERCGDVDDGSKEDLGAIESMDDPQDSPPPERATNIEEFRKELTLKREARQRAIAAVSSEMERLRRELDAEKEAHSETTRMLDLLRSAQNESRARSQPITPEDTSMTVETREQQFDAHDEATMQRLEAQRLSSILKVSDELRNDIRIQIDKVDDLRYHLETDPDRHRYRIRCLSDLTNRTREAVYTRESRASDLKDHLAQILARLGDRSFSEQKDDVGLECERQLENINSLKSLYNERLKVLSELKDAALTELAETKMRLDHTLKKCECLEEDLKKADEKIDVQDTEISNLESQLGLTKADCRDLQNQMSLINGLFTQMLLGATSADMDLDRLTQLLQENHDLICDMAREEGTEAAALPKLLLDLIEQVEGSKGSQKRADDENAAEGEPERKEDDLQQEDIAHNLPKVWRVLLELLSCHAEGTPSASAASSSDPNICYKSVDTPAGPRLVISVSKTYIRLKELILEKKHLEKEMNRMKQLNVHLESKLGEQEKRLSTVSAELSKTWTIVDRMQAQHQQLHTHEKILRYELQQKRKMLQELKQELEYCREKWESARQKNTNTELEWRSLRREFAARKALAGHDSFNNSAESGFSDERGDDTDEEDNAVEDRIRLGPRRRPRKESPRAPTPDTESEQPTDTELSEPKTGSTATLEQRTPTPETEAELDETEATDSTPNTDSTTATETPTIPESPRELLNPLDQALTNVIQNLIGIDDNITSTSASFANSNSDTVSGSRTGEKEGQSSIERSRLQSLTASVPKDSEPVEGSLLDFRDADSYTEDQSSPTVEDLQRTGNTDGENTRHEESSISSVSCAPSVPSAQSVFSIGPFPPANLAASAVKNVQFSDPLVVGPSNRFFAPVFGAALSEEPVPSPGAASTSQLAESKEKFKDRLTESPPSQSEVSAKESSSRSDKISVHHVAMESSSPSSCPAEAEKPRETSSASMDAGSSRPEEKRVGKSRTPEEALAAREDRLKRLEEQAKWLMNKMNATSRRGSALSTRLEELHEVYGEPPVPPPMPDILPSRRLRTTLSDLPQQVPESSTTEGTKNTEEPVSCSDSNKSPANEAP